MKSTDNVVVSVTAASQRDFQSKGYSGNPYDPVKTSSEFLRNSALPILNVNLKYISTNIVVGVGANYKSLMPRLKTNTGIKTDERINSMAFQGFAKLIKGDLTLKAEGVYGTDMADLLMLGGYAEIDTAIGTTVEKYTALKTLSVWGEVIKGKAVQYALFAGYTENLGADDDIIGNCYLLGSNIANVMRIAPRVQITKGKIRFACEVDYTTANYGTTGIKGKVQNTKSISNLRILFASYLFF